MKVLNKELGLNKRVQEVKINKITTTKSSNILQFKSRSTLDREEITGEYYVYAHILSATDEIFYVGTGKGNRINVKHNRNALWNATTANNEYYVVKVAEGFMNRVEAVKAEVDYQQQLKPSACIQYGDGLVSQVSQATKDKISAAMSGDLNHFHGKNHTEETKAHLSMLQTGDKNNMFGQNHTEESKSIMSECQKGSKNSMAGKKHTAEARVKMCNTGLKSFINCRGEVFASGKLAAEAFNVSATGITCNAKGKAKSAGKYSDGSKIKWAYYNK